MRSSKTRIEVRLLSLIGALGLILVWWVASVSEWVNPILLPPPHKVATEIASFVTSLSTLNDLWQSIQRILIAFVLSTLIGVPVGIVLGLFSFIAELLEFPVEFFRALPATALYPVFMLFFGVGDNGKLILVVFACSLITLIYAMYGVRGCSALRLKAAQAMRLSGLKLFYKVILPESLPNIVSGLRISLSLVLVLVVVLEMFTGSTQGMGKRIYDASQTFRVTEMYAAIAIVGILGYVLNKLVTFFDQKFVHWAGR